MKQPMVHPYAKWLAVLSLFVLTVVFMVVFASDNGASTSKANVRFDETETETLAHWQLLPMKMGRVRVWASRSTLRHRA